MPSGEADITIYLLRRFSYEKNQQEYNVFLCDARLFNIVTPIHKKARFFLSKKRAFLLLTPSHAFGAFGEEMIACFVNQAHTEVDKEEQHTHSGSRCGLSGALHAHNHDRGNRCRR